MKPINQVLVTGGAGFIGSNFIHMLCELREGWRIVNFDALTYAGNLENLREVEDRDDYHFVRGDVSSEADVSRALEACGEGSLYVVHMAAESHVDRSILSGMPFVQANVVGTQVLLDACRARGVERFVHVSTDEVYGEAAGGDGAEPSAERDALMPKSPYAASKAGMHGMHYKLQSELGPRGVRLHVVCPGSIATPLKLDNIAQAATLAGEDPEAAREQARQSLGDPMGIAKVLAFLSSEDGSYINGTVFTR